MARSSNALPLALVALVSSGLLYRPAGDASRLMTAPADSRAAAGLSDATGDGANEKAKKKDQDNKESDKPKPDLHRDALDVLGEHCGIDLTDDGLLAQIGR